MYQTNKNQKEIKKLFKETPRMVHISIKAQVKINHQQTEKVIAIVTEHFLTFLKKNSLKKLIILADYHQFQFHKFEIINEATVHFQKNNDLITIISPQAIQLTKIFIRNLLFSIPDISKLQIISKGDMDFFPLFSPKISPSQKFQFSFYSYCSLYHQKYNHQIVQCVNDLYLTGNPILDLSLMPLLNKSSVSLLEPIFQSLINEPNIRGIQCNNLNVPILLESMADFINQNTSLAILSVPNCHIKTGSRVLGDSFKNNPNLKLQYLDLSSNPISDINELIESLKYLQSPLFYLNLNDIPINQKETKTLFDAIIKNKKLHSLSHLLINKATINPSVLKVFSFSITPIKDNLKHLDLGPINKGSLILFQQLMKCETPLEVLKFAGSKIESDSMNIFSSFLKKTSSLKELDISRTNLTDDEIKNVIKVIQTNKYIKSFKLHLNYMKIHEKGISSFISSFSEKELDKWNGLGLEGNKFNTSDLHSLNDLFINMSNLSWLNLSCNFKPSMVDLGKELVNVLSIPKISFIELRGNIKNEENKVKHKRYICDQVLYTFVSFLSKIKIPIGLDLRYNSIEDKVILKLGEMAMMNKITKLLLDYDKITNIETLTTLCESISSSKSMILFNFPLKDYYKLSKKKNPNLIDNARIKSLRNVMKNQIDYSIHSSLSLCGIPKINEIIDDSIIEMNNCIYRPIMHSIFSEYLGLPFPFQNEDEKPSDIVKPQDRKKISKIYDDGAGFFYSIPELLIEDTSTSTPLHYEVLSSKRQESISSYQNHHPINKPNTFKQNENDDSKSSKPKMIQKDDKRVKKSTVKKGRDKSSCSSFSDDHLISKKQPTKKILINSESDSFDSHKPRNDLKKNNIKNIKEKEEKKHLSQKKKTNNSDLLADIGIFFSDDDNRERFDYFPKNEKQQNNPYSKKQGRRTKAKKSIIELMGEIGINSNDETFKELLVNASSGKRQLMNQKTIEINKAKRKSTVNVSTNLSDDISITFDDEPKKKVVPKQTNPKRKLKKKLDLSKILEEEGSFSLTLSEKESIPSSKKIHTKIAKENKNKKHQSNLSYSSESEGLKESKKTNRISKQNKKNNQSNKWKIQKKVLNEKNYDESSSDQQYYEKQNDIKQSKKEKKKKAIKILDDYDETDSSIVISNTTNSRKNTENEFEEESFDQKTKKDQKSTKQIFDYSDEMSSDHKSKSIRKIKENTPENSEEEKFDHKTKNNKKSTIKILDYSEEENSDHESESIGKIKEKTSKNSEEEKFDHKTKKDKKSTKQIFDYSDEMSSDHKSKRIGRIKEKITENSEEEKFDHKTKKDQKSTMKILDYSEEENSDHESESIGKIKEKTSKNSEEESNDQNIKEVQKSKIINNSEEESSIQEIIDEIEKTPKSQKEMKEQSDNKFKDEYSNDQNNLIINANKNSEEESYNNVVKEETNDKFANDEKSKEEVINESSDQEINEAQKSDKNIEKNKSKEISDFENLENEDINDKTENQESENCIDLNNTKNIKEKQERIIKNDDSSVIQKTKSKERDNIVSTQKSSSANNENKEGTQLVPKKPNVNLIPKKQIKNSKYKRNGGDEINNVLKAILGVSKDENEKLKEKKYEYFLKDFIFLKQLGEGSFGRVYKVKYIKTGEYFAAKVLIHKIKNQESSDFKNLSSEVNIISKLIHPSIVKFIYFSPTDIKKKNRPTIITEFASHGSLEDLIKLEREKESKHLTDTTKLVIIYGIAAGMKFLHSHNILHRDLKPANILIDQYLHPKISDFGLSKIKQADFYNSTKEGVTGTPRYISPEIYLNKEYTKAGDVYAFGIILFEIFTLEIPFEGMKYCELTLTIANGGRPEIKKPIPDIFRNLIERCWAQEPKDRPTFDEIENMLKNEQEFCFNTIDEDHFLNYVNYVDDYKVGFDDSLFIEVNLQQEGSRLIKEIINGPKLKHYPYREYYKLNDEESKTLVQEAETKPDKQFLLAKNLIKGLYEFPLKPDLGISYLTKAIDGGCKEATAYYCKKLIKGTVLLKNHKRAKKILNKYMKEQDSEMYSYLMGRMYVDEENYEEAIHHFVSFSYGPMISFHNDDCMYEYAQLLLEGKGISKDRDKAIKLINFGIDKKHPKSILQLGILLINDRKISKALDFIKGAADLGCIRAIYMYAQLIEMICHENYEDYYKMAADRGHMESIIKYSNWISSTYGLKNKYPISNIFYMKKASDRGDIRAVYYYALLLIHSEENYKEGMKYMKIAADNNIANGMKKYADLLVCGRDGIEINEEEGILYYKMAIEYGNVDAIGSLAQLLDYGNIDCDKDEIIELYELAISKGDDDAMNNYAYMIQHGRHGVEVDINKAIYYYKMAIEKGNISAKNNYAIILNNGIGGVEVNKEKAKEYYKLGAESGSPASMYNYACMLIKGNDDEKEEAIYYYKKAAELNDIESIIEYGKMLMNGIYVEQDHKTATEYFKKGALLGNAECMYLYGLMLYENANKREAAKYIKQSADKGYIKAINKYARMLYNGDGIPKNNEESAKYYKIAISKGSKSAQRNYERTQNGEKVIKKEENSIEFYKSKAEEGDFEAMYKYAVALLDEEEDDDDSISEGIKYLKESAEGGCVDAMMKYASYLYVGDFVPVNIELSMYYFKKAADLGEVTPMVNYAFYMLRNKSIPNHYEISAKYYKMAADRGDKRAMLRIGELLSEGNGVPMNKLEALKYFKLAGENGESTGFNNYAYMLYYGDGVPIDQEEGIKYFKIASDQGDEDAIGNYLDVLLKDKTPENVQEAIKYCKIGIEKCVPKAMFYMGTLYDNGIGVEADKKKALEYYKMGADKGHGLSMAYYGLKLYSGVGVPEDKEKALIYIEMAKRNNIIVKIDDETI